GEGGEGDSDHSKALHSLIKHEVPIITVTQLKGGDTHKTLVLLDTRKMEEYRVSHIKGARHVGYKKFKLKNVANIPKETAIVVYCSLGVRSENIGKKLLHAGYKDVRNLLGGIFEWINQGNPVYDMTGSTTTRIHAYSKKWSKWLSKGKIVFE
ncbi:MAG: rhodanese-like domain-containing protein, partial [bacterium]|nr:rhodanese-like domain-containing protein [bacterium]